MNNRSNMREPAQELIANMRLAGANWGEIANQLGNTHIPSWYKSAYGDFSNELEAAKVKELRDKGESWTGVSKILTQGKRSSGYYSNKYSGDVEAKKKAKQTKYTESGERQKEIAKNKNEINRKIVLMLIARQKEKEAKKHKLVIKPGVGKYQFNQRWCDYK